MSTGPRGDVSAHTYLYVATELPMSGDWEGCTETVEREWEGIAEGVAVPYRRATHWQPEEGGMVEDVTFTARMGPSPVPQMNPVRLFEDDLEGIAPGSYDHMTDALYEAAIQEDDQW